MKDETKTSRYDMFPISLGGCVLTKIGIQIQSGIAVDKDKSHICSRLSEKICVVAYSQIPM